MPFGAVMPAPLLPAWYGKLPSLGDFASRRLDPDAVAFWDDWLCAALLGLREAQPDDWLSTYLGAPRWQFVLLPGAFATGVDPGGVTTRVGGAGRDELVEFTCVWSADPTGAVLDARITPLGGDAEWARVGVSFSLGGDWTHADWFGLGPGPAYPDTGQGARLGWHSATLAELTVPNVRPQESGSRAGIRQLVLAGEGHRLEFTAEPFSATIRPWSTEAVAAATHREQLVSDGRTHVVIDVARQGIGTAACGPGVLPEYRLDASPHHLTLHLAMD